MFTIPFIIWVVKNKREEIKSEWLTAYVVLLTFMFMDLLVVVFVMSLLNACTLN
jgi:hypothetical protein